jgi:hypothetical protein
LVQNLLGLGHDHKIIRVADDVDLAGLYKIKRGKSGREAVESA